MNKLNCCWKIKITTETVDQSYRTWSLTKTTDWQGQHFQLAGAGPCPCPQYHSSQSRMGGSGAVTGLSFWHCLAHLTVGWWTQTTEELCWCSQYKITLAYFRPGPGEKEWTMGYNVGSRATVFSLRQHLGVCVSRGVRPGLSIQCRKPEVTRCLFLTGLLQCV